MLFCSSMVKVVIIVLLCGMWRRALRGHDIHHSVWEHKQYNSEKNRRWRRNRDAGWGLTKAQNGGGLRQILGHCAKFGRKKEQAIAALLTQRNIEEAARSIGVAPNTLLNWMKLPEFQAAYREARRAAFGQSIARLRQGYSAAATILMKLMLDANTPASTRVRAAETIINHAGKAIEIEDIEARVSELERAAEASNPGHTRRNR
jgi:transposase-like protein